MEISVWMMGFDEAHNLLKLFAPLKGIEDIVFIDHESTDNTAKIAKELGARVFKRKFLYDKVKKNDVSDFVDHFSYVPLFKTGDTIPHSGKERSECQKYCKNDWVLNLDCDEVIKWDYKKIQEKLSLVDVINCKYYHTHIPESKREDWFQVSRLYNRKRTFWIGRIHEVVNGHNLRMGWSNNMEIDHYQNLNKDRSSNVNVLEYAVLRDQDTRSFYYLGKEYHYHGHFEKAINMLTLYLKEAWYIAEKVHAYLMIADSMYNLGREDEGWVYATQALKLNPMSQKTYLLLAKMAPIKEKEIWLKHSELAVNDHLL